MRTAHERIDDATGVSIDVRRSEDLLRTGALQRAIFNSANFSSIATDAKGVIQIFNVGAERLLGYKAAEVVNKITPADISDPQEVIARAGCRMIHDVEESIGWMRRNHPQPPRNQTKKLRWGRTP